MKDGNNGDKTKEQLVIELEEVGGVLKLKREHYTNRADESTPPDATSFIAKYIDSDPAKTNCSFSEPVLTFTVTATVGGGSLQDGSETRIFEIVHRAVADS